MNADALCLSCRQPKVTSTCEACAGPLCKKCVQRLDPDAFSFLKKVPEGCSHSVYCRFCYDDKVAAPLEDYLATMARAKEAFVFFTTQRKEIPLLRKSKEVLRVESCPDRDETILRLAFFAAQKGFNAIIETDVRSKKIKDGRYQHFDWSGTGIPAQVDAEKVERHDARKQIYR